MSADPEMAAVVSSRAARLFIINAHCGVRGVCLVSLCVCPRAPAESGV